MTETRRRQSRLLLALAVFSLGCYWCSQCATSASAEPGIELKRGQPKSQESPKAQVKVLLKERLVALRELADMIGNSGNTAEIFRANLAVLYAEFELCDNDRERLAVLERVVAAAKQFEAHIGDAGVTVSANTRIRARLSRIDAELGLERFKAALKGPAK